MARDHRLEIRVRPALPEEREALRELQRRAALANPGDRQALLAHPDVIDLPAEHLLDDRTLVACSGRALLGFAVVLPASGNDAELDGLFVEPGWWRQGIGRRLLLAACALARARGVRCLRVIANAHAEAFYRATGFVHEGPVDTQFGVAARMSLPL